MPFLGKEIVKKSDRIEIYQPEEVKNFVHVDGDLERAKLYIVNKDNIVVATIDPMNIEINYGYESRSSYRFGYNPDVTIRGYIVESDPEKLQDAFYYR